MVYNLEPHKGVNVRESSSSICMEMKSLIDGLYVLYIPKPFTVQVLSPFQEHIQKALLYLILDPFLLHTIQLSGSVWDSVYCLRTLQTRGSDWMFWGIDPPTL